ncbi:competence protein CoiA [Niallia nealsonii]|uniref:Competence protein CoiA n=1 Tax=Niallia nealsonii TaxID=115979 RepID=A0A2N0Z7R7_9BACI|nr:competence protein CoiA family protein [Niallia nealsonii]PKG25550.1 hypothetical protein CWS01_01515 [Niallia nealsonii]
MFTAKLESGQIINLWKTKRGNLKKMRQNVSFYCPECNGKVILKMGEKKIMHFAHERERGCQANAEAESSYHLEGKLQLYYYLKRMGLNPELEPYFSFIKQRGDIGVVINNQYYVIEYQCSPINTDLLRKRTSGYLSRQIVPIWILGFKNMKKVTRGMLRLSTFSSQFIVNYHEQYILPSYCSIQQKFYFYHSFFPLTVNQTYCICTTKSLKELTDFPSIQKYNPMLPLDQWKHGIRKQKMYHIHYQTNINNQFLKEIYLHKLHPHFLPPYIGIPLPSTILFETPSLFWQTFVIIDSFLGENKGKIISFQKILDYFYRRIDNQHIKLRKLLLETDEKSWKHAVLDYLQTLVKINIVQEIKPNFFLFKGEIKTDFHYQNQHLWEDEFYKKYAKVLLARKINEGGIG